MATIAITGAMRTTATDISEVHANVLPIELLMLYICYRAAIHMVTLPASHLLAKPLKTCANKLVRHHPSPIHHLLHTFGLKLDDFETIKPALQVPNKVPLFTTKIAESREESTEADEADEPDAKIYTDGSGLDNNAGSAAVMYRRGRCTKTLRYYLGPLTDHTTYEVEAVGVTLALKLLSHERGIGKAMILLDNQVVIQSLGHVKSLPAQQILSHAHELANRAAALTRQ